ncbi:hypothetical protein L1286_22330 [Pseudoalteromonas sp. SMS1]|uniref:flagellar M-ring protein FliF C-terminal domain-containing protein n=1 Tax=Pseudoalteromonas sp. SMS1 TaxID=2908894 RepID=UPI001F292E87|nr:flagellar M-ring protein FliF C-terminal domain-containing protein [Pseudoalteromonas sp. SMS1]MCF2860222.1 hypothetical protein [Pseudoalteromonas sp. SMS1]
MKEFWTSLSSGKQKSLLVTLVALVIITVSLIIFVLQTRYSELPVNVESQQIGLISSLEEQGIEYKLGASGELLVNEQALAKSHMLLEQQKQSQFPSQGLELFDNADYSMTTHAQAVTMQRALQGELERTLGAMPFITYARVHLTFSEKKLFADNADLSKASVTVFPEQNTQLSAVQIQGIQNLVASSVKDLQVENVLIFGPNGELISNSTTSDEQTTRLDDFKSQQESALEQKIEKLLSLYLEPEQYAVSSSIVIDRQDIVAVKKELLTVEDGKGHVIKEKRNVSTQNAEAGSQSNQGLSHEEVQYAHGSRTEELKSHAGAVKQVSVAVALNAEISDEQVQSLTGLIKAAIGFDQSRGDKVQVSNFPPIAKLSSEATALKPVTAIVAEPVVNSVEATEPSSEKVSSYMMVLWIVVALLVVACLFFALRSKKPKLTQQEQEALLLEINDWIKKPEEKHAH